mgnify:CR=1 FL=1
MSRRSFTALARSRRSMTRLALAAGLCCSVSVQTALAEEFWWIGENGVWSDVSNWSTGGVPGLDPPYNAVIRLGNVPGVANHTVFLDHAPTGGAMVYSALYISNGMTLDANNRELGTLTGSTVLTGNGSRLIIRPSIGPNFHDLTTYELDLGANTQLELHTGSRVSTGILTSSGIISGRGTLHLQGTSPGGVSFTNDGTITGNNAGGLTFLQQSPGRMDLDGISGTGQLNMIAPFGQLTFEGDTLADDFSGDVFMGSGALLTMNMSDGWTADANSTFNVSSSIVGAAAQIDGGHFTFGGSMNIGGSQGALRILADTTFAASADVFVGTDDILEVDGATTVLGGDYTVSQGGRIRFDGPTTVRGGTFSTFTDDHTDGSIDFAGPTTWNGTVNFSGAARQLGDATVSGATVINADVFGMDGTGDTVWNINNALTINADAIRSTGTNGFTGEMNIAGGFFGRLTMNLHNSIAWSMLGTMNLSGDQTIHVTRVAGDRMALNGALHVTSGRVQITADVIASSLASIDVGPTTASPRFTGTTSMVGDMTFSGQGTIVNGTAGSMRIHSGADLGGLGLTNSGSLELGLFGTALAPALVTVDRFENTVTGVWHVDLGGYLAGTQHDRLRVTGSALLDGTLLVSLADLGAGMFAPSVGDVFTILLADGDVSGVFINDPVTHANGLTYEWTVLYGLDHVALRLDTIVPTPGSVALFGVAGLLAARRRRTGTAR